MMYEHDLRLVAVSAVICILGCFTTTTFMARIDEVARKEARYWIISAAAVFGCSVWSLHFIAMLAFMPGQQMAYHVGLTVLSIFVAAGGALAAMSVRYASFPRSTCIALSGVLLGFAVSGMHYVGVFAMSVSGFLLFDRGYVAASLLVSVVLSMIALGRATDLTTMARRFEVCFWLALAICGLHFTGMTAITIAPDVAEAAGGEVLGKTTLAIAVGSVSVIILTASLTAVLIERRLSQRTMQDLSRMRLMNNLATEILLIHRDGILLEVNSAGERLFKAPASHLVGRAVLSLFASDSAPALIRRELCHPSERRPEEVSIRAVGGASVLVEMSCQLIEYLGRPATVVSLRDLTDRKRDEARIGHLARHDALTDLLNRYAFHERLNVALDMAAQQGSTLAVVYIDLDRFKQVNDLHGHAAGDGLLVQASKRILAELRPTDTLARIGGDEFVMVLTGQPQPEKASMITTRVIETLCRPFQIEEHRIEIGASVGVALYPDDGTNADALMRAADAAMYRAKEEGSGSVRFYEAAMNAQLQSRLQLKQELAGAAGRGELVLHYQPIVNGVTGEVETFEALIRWVHPTRGMVPPMEFIPLAEQCGLIDGIGRWVIDTAFREAAGWSHSCRVSINVSPRQFRHTDVCAAIGSALLTHEIAPARVVVEVTEGILIEDAEKAVVILNRLREMGVRIALDDFGTGYSSLSYLQLFQFDKFKIDKSFVRMLGESDRALTLTRTIVNLGHNLGLQVTAEGVETQAQLDMLRSLGCDQIQGYLVARPAPIEAFTDLDRLRTKALFGRSRTRLSA